MRWSPYNSTRNWKWAPACLEYSQVYRTRQNSSKGTEEAGGVIHQVSFNNLPAVLVDHGGSSWLEVTECGTHLQEWKVFDCLGKLLTAITWHIWESWVIRSWHRFIKSGSCFTYLISFYSKITPQWIGKKKKRLCMFLYLSCSKAFDNISNSILLEKLSAYGLNRCRTREKNWLDDQSERIRVNGFQSSWQSITSVIPQGSVSWPV